MSCDPAWERVRMGWRNTRRQQGRIQHPHHVMHALLVPAVKAAWGDAPGDPIWGWRPAGAWPAEVEKGCLLELDVVFPARPANLGRSFGEALEKAPPPANFRLELLAAPARRTLGDLQAAHTLDLAADEVCLDFLTPLFWPLQTKRPLSAGERWRLDAHRLRHLLHQRLRHFFGTALPPDEAPPPAIEVRAFCARRSGPESGHPSRSGSGRRMLLGLSGPVYVRGDWPALLPQLLLGAELQLGSNATIGQGSYRLATGRPHFDTRLGELATWQRARRDFDLRLVEKGRPPEEALPAPAELPALCAAALLGTLRLAPARRAQVPKKAGAPPAAEPAPFTAEAREIALLPPREQFLHYVLQRVLASAFDRLFLDESIGSRRGCSRESARPFVQRALEEGATHVALADIEDCFGGISWVLLRAQLRRWLPRGDTATLALLEACLAQPLADFDGTPLVRARGLLQGSPLSSLLANLYLHEADAAWQAAGRSFIRYVDDLCFFAASREDAETALRQAGEALAALGLKLKTPKVAIASLDAGFSYLGLTFARDEPAGEQTGARFHRRLFLTRPSTWGGLDGASITVREGDTLLERVPLERVEELILCGAGGVSVGLIERCLARKIPVTFCSQAGHYHGTLHGDRREFYARVGRHHRRHAESAGEWPRHAAAIAQAKLANYLPWLARQPAAAAGALRRLLRQRHEAIARHLGQTPPAAAIAAMRGEEGAAAAAVFPWVNARVPLPEWQSPRRRPRERPDRWNALLDTLSFLLFSHLNTLLRTRGLDPYLGFLHSSQDRYESLTCDLMEPFRARLDRFALWLVREQAIVPAMCVPDEEGKWGFQRDGWAALLEQFERQLDFAYAADRGRTWRVLLRQQVEDLERWVDEGAPLRIYAHPVEPWQKERKRPAGA